MSFNQFILLVMVDVPVTVLLRRKLYTLTSGLLSKLALHLFSLLAGTFYVILLKDDEVFYVDVGLDGDFYRNLVIVNALIFAMVVFHAWTISAPHGCSVFRWRRK